MHDNNVSSSSQLTPADFWKALEAIREMKAHAPVSEPSLVSDDWSVDWARLREDDPMLWHSCMESTSENAGVCVVPVHVLDMLSARGYLTRAVPEKGGLDGEQQ